MNKIRNFMNLSGRTYVILKKIFAVLLVDCLAILLAACSPSVNSERTPQTQEETRAQESVSSENSETDRAEEGQEQVQTADTKPLAKADVSGIYTDKQGTPDVYSELTLTLQEDGTYAVEIGIYRTGTLRGTAVWKGDELRFTGEAPHNVSADISIVDGKAEMTVISDSDEFLDADVYSFADGAPEEQAEMTADELLDLFVNGSINAVDPEDPAAVFYITDLNIDSEAWDAYSVGEKIDLDNDGENELILNGPYGGIYLDAHNNQVYKFAEGEGEGFTLSYTYYKGAIWILYSNRMHQGYESYHMELFEGADNLVEEMNFNEELNDEDNAEVAGKYYLNGTEITYDEYLELSGEIFAAQVCTD